ncbi:MAG: type II toxin-antitoxin system PemK/MazF family toxin [Nocardioides sp.]
MIDEVSPAGQASAAESYAPEADGEPDPGEVVWAWVPFEEDPTQGKDRPVLLIGCLPLAHGDQQCWLGLPMTSKDHDRDAHEEAKHGRHWMDVGTGDWDPKGRPSEVRLDRVIRLTAGEIRRADSVLDRTLFAQVVAAASAYSVPLGAVGG